MNSIVFIDGSESFIVESIIKNLVTAGVACETVDWDKAAIENAADLITNIVVAYVDDIDDIEDDAAKKLEEVCSKENVNLYFMGRGDDIEELKNKVDFSNVAGEFLRPINANEVADKLSKSVSGDSINIRNHILVVDDSGTMLSTIQDWLGVKYRVSVANSAMNALTFLNKSIPDLILLDYEMPECSGAQFLEMLRADTNFSSIPVIFLTGKDDPESVKKVLALKPVGYLLKNMPKEHIISQVDEFFNK